MLFLEEICEEYVVPVSADSQFIKDVGRRLRKTLTSSEIATLCMVADESDIVKYVDRGFMKLVTYWYGADGVSPGFKIVESSKYLILTQSKIIGLDDKRTHFYETHKITFYSIWSGLSRRATEIFCHTLEDQTFLMLGMADGAAMKFSNGMNIFRDDNDEDEDYSRIRVGMTLAKALFEELAVEDIFSMQDIYLMLDHPGQWGSSNPKDTPANNLDGSASL